MADVTPDREYAGDKDKQTWLALTSSNSAGEVYEPGGTRAGFATVQFTGTFDGATAVLQGSHDSTTWFTLKDVNGSDVSFTAAGGAEISTAISNIRPSTSGGGGSQDIDCILEARG